MCQKRYDVVLMNPPFGDSSKVAKALIERWYPVSKNDLYAAFVERGLKWLQEFGLIGAITSRSGFYISSFEKWRQSTLLQDARPTAFADLGYGVLDSAMVETAAYCFESKGTERVTQFFQLQDSEEKGDILRRAINNGTNGERSAGTYFVHASSFKQVPGAPFAYWVNDRVASCIDRPHTRKYRKTSLHWAFNQE